MAPSGLAILIGAGPATGAGIARILAHPSHGNLAVALLARRPDALNDLKATLQKQAPNAVFETFATDTTPDKLRKAFSDIKSHSSFSGLKLKAAVYNVKFPQKKPFLEETYDGFTDHLDHYVGGAFQFAQLSVQRLFDDHGSQSLAEGSGKKKGTIIFTGTLGAMRANVGFGAYGAGRAGVRMLAQALAREHTANGIHIAHIIANGKIEDADNEDTQRGKSIAAEAVGHNYLWLINQEPTCWIHELDLRPAQEKF